MYTVKVNLPFPYTSCLQPTFHTFYSLTVLSNTPLVLPLFSFLFFPGSPLLITIGISTWKDFVYQDITCYFFEFGIFAIQSYIGWLYDLLKLGFRLWKGQLGSSALAIYFANLHMRTLHCDLFLDYISHLAFSVPSLPHLFLYPHFVLTFIWSLCLSYLLFMLFLLLIYTFFAHAYFCHQLKCYLCCENLPQLFSLKCLVLAVPILWPCCCLGHGTSNLY